MRKKKLSYRVAENISQAIGRRTKGHAVCLFICNHWWDVCIGILRTMGLEDYLKKWGEDPCGSRCRGCYEDNVPFVFVEEECPTCKAGTTKAAY